ncbi:hypothetical protein H0H93_006334 [Arthromyces matolae]|nr:hypothetical protein H0H93_006334 [Arthromyces matolae]
MSSQNPTLQAIYALDTTLNIIRTLQPDLSPIPNITSFGSAATVYVQLYYDGVEQFYCEADTCSQTLGNGTDSANFDCQNLQCTCRAGTTFCGGYHPADLTKTINGLGGTLNIDCDPVDNTTNTATCHFQQKDLLTLFPPSGLTLNGCSFGECVRQSVIDTGGNVNSAAVSSGKPLSGGVIAGLAVVGGLVLLAFLFMVFGYVRQRKARHMQQSDNTGMQVDVHWSSVTYSVPVSSSSNFLDRFGSHEEKTVLDNVSGSVQAGQMMAILGPSGAGKTTLAEIIARKHKSGTVTGNVTLSSRISSNTGAPRIGFVPQQDVLPPTLTVYEALLFAARLRLPENVPDIEKRGMVEELMAKLGISALRDNRIGHSESMGGKTRGISGGEMRRVSIGLELISRPDVLILDEPTSGLDSVSASRVAQILHDIAHDPVHPIPVIASIHQPSSKLYQTFDSILLLSHGRALYSGPGGFAPSEYFAKVASNVVPAYPAGYNVADYLLDIASDPNVSLFQISEKNNTAASSTGHVNGESGSSEPTEKSSSADQVNPLLSRTLSSPAALSSRPQLAYATTFLTQLQVLAGREWKILRRDKSLFLAHVATSSVLGVFCGGLYYKTDETIAGFQSRIGCLFFLGALIAFSSLSALYNLVETRPLFLRERSIRPPGFYRDSFLMSYHYELFRQLLFHPSMTLFNFLLGAFYRNGGVAILLSALSALYQMTFAGFFVHLNDIPPVLRWLQWLCPLKYTLEALAVNEVGSGLLIQDTLQGVPVSVSASLIMNMLFGFGADNYYRDVLVLFAFIAGFAVGVIAIVWWKVRERR